MKRKRVNPGKVISYCTCTPLKGLKGPFYIYVDTKVKADNVMLELRSKPFVKYIREVIND